MPLLFTRMAKCFFLVLIVPLCTRAQTAVHEEKYLSIGGIEQWITIKGEDRTKPMVLFLHGGPGSVMSPYSQAVTGHWEKDFILVNWDQRGAGRTFGRNAPANDSEDYWIENPLTVAQMTKDAIELTRYLVAAFKKEKIIIMGTSWGSVLGANMALQHPELFYAYIGHAQVVNASGGLLNAFARVKEMAQQNNDEPALNELKLLGKPPYADARHAGQLLRLVKKFEAMYAKPAPAAWWQPASIYDNPLDDKNREEGDDYSFIHFAGHQKLGIKPMSTPNLLLEGLLFKIPVYFVQGQHDILTPPDKTKTYFDKIKAPAKEYILLPNAAHGYNQAVVDTQFTILKDIIRKYIKE